jgi:hypothetical protein
MRWDILNQRKYCRTTKEDVVCLVNSEIDSIKKHFLNHANYQVKERMNRFLEDQSSYFYNLDISNKKLISKNGNKIYTRLKKKFIKKPLYTCANLFSFVNEFIYDDYLPITYDNNFFKNSSCSIFTREVINIEESKYLLNIDSLVIELIDIVSKKEVQMEFNYSIENIDFLSSELSIFLEINIGNTKYYELDNYCIHIKILGTNIAYKTNYPLWIDNILQASIYLDRGNLKLASMFSFVALDSFVELMYKSVFSYYEISFDLEYDYMKNNFDFYIFSRLYDLEKDLLDFMSSGRANRAISKVEEKIILSKDKILSEIKLCTNSILDHWGNVRRDLIGEKLKDIRDLLGIKHESLQYKGMMQLLQKIQKIKKNRDDIAHGNKLTYKIDGNEVFEVLTYILSIIFKEDFKVTNWNKLIIKKDIIKVD